jgi:hypothetical protein
LRTALQRCNNHCNSILYEEQRRLVSERLSGSCQSNSDDILAIENGMDDVNLPETWTKAKNLLDLDLNVFIRFRHNVRTARHGKVKSGDQCEIESKGKM